LLSFDTGFGFGSAFAALTSLVLLLEPASSARPCVRLSHSATLVSHDDCVLELIQCVSSEVDMPMPEHTASWRMSPCWSAMPIACFIAMTALKILLSSLPDTNVWLLRVLMATQRLTSQVLSSRDTARGGDGATPQSFPSMSALSGTF